MMDTKEFILSLIAGIVILGIFYMVLLAISNLIKVDSFMECYELTDEYIYCIDKFLR